MVKLVIFIAVTSEGTNLVPAKRRRVFDPFPKAEGLTYGMPVPTYDNEQLKKDVESIYIVLYKNELCYRIPFGARKELNTITSTDIGLPSLLHLAQGFSWVWRWRFARREGWIHSCSLAVLQRYPGP